MKSGYKTSEFWLAIVSNLLIYLGAVDVPNKYKWIVTAASVLGYQISRGLAKVYPPKDETSFDPTGPEAEIPGGGPPTP